MKLREVVRAIPGFLYEVWEYDVFPGGKVSRCLIELKIDETNIRCKQFNMHHEKIVKGEWFIITPEEFQENLKYETNNKVKIRRKTTGETQTKQKIRLNLIDMLIITEHAKQRLEERFNVPKDLQRSFLESKLDGHFIVQNYKFFNHTYNEHPANALVLCSKDFRHLFVVVPQNGRYVMLTCFDPYEYSDSAFQRWFSANIERVHEMPSLEDYRSC